MGDRDPASSPPAALLFAGRLTLREAPRSAGVSLALPDRVRPSGAALAMLCEVPDPELESRLPGPASSPASGSRSVPFRAPKGTVGAGPSDLVPLATCDPP